jgi:hypothetical protein
MSTSRGVSRSAEPPPPIFPKKIQPRRRREGKNFRNFQAAAAARVVSSLTGLEFFKIFACFF